uniref:C2H2-type domain-containing protein n=1 Tax=Paramormyrops kingsleyae TaxID=1676925 RepID=A0A3B3RZ79_9TELE
MTSCNVFRTQMTTILDVLAKAAVSEICKLVDDGYAVLRLEISRSKEENQTLKRKLKVMELMIAQGCVAPEESDSDKAACKGDLTSGDAQFMATVEPSYASLWRDDDSDSIADNDGRFELQLIKQEILEEDFGQRDCQEELRMYAKSAEGPAEAAAGLSVLDTKATSAEDVEELPRQQSNGASVWEGSRSGDNLKAELENGTLSQMPQQTGSEKSMERGNALAYDYITCERLGHAEGLSAPRFSDRGTKEVAAFFTSEPTSKCQPLSSSLQSLPPPWSDTGNCTTSAEVLNVKLAAARMDTDYFKVETDLSSTWDEGGRMANMEQDHQEQQQRHSESSNCVPTYSSESQMAESEDIAAELKSRAPGLNGWDPYDNQLTETVNIDSSVEANMDRLICVYCGKSFACQNVLETHQRIHTGEKPFQCTQCEKRFAQLSNLIIHKRVHTGEKPYCCTYCGKQFAQSRYLVTHQRVHTGEKPFKCTQCGKRFAQSNNLIRHQSVHTGRKPFRCSQCGKCFTTSSHRKRHESVHSGKKTM